MTDQLDRLNAAFADRYQVLRELGAGSMATVYLAGVCPLWVSAPSDCRAAIAEPDLTAQIVID